MQIWQEEEGTTEMEEREGEGQRQREGETVEASGRSSLGFVWFVKHEPTKTWLAVDTDFAPPLHSLGLP